MSMKIQDQKCIYSSNVIQGIAFSKTGQDNSNLISGIILNKINLWIFNNSVLNIKKKYNSSPADIWELFLQLWKNMKFSSLGWGTSDFQNSV